MSGLKNTTRQQSAKTQTDSNRPHDEPAHNTTINQTNKTTIHLTISNFRPSNQPIQNSFYSQKGQKKYTQE
jgi:hypothetical protein